MRPWEAVSKTPKLKLTPVCMSDGTTRSTRSALQPFPHENGRVCGFSPAPHVSNHLSVMTGYAWVSLGLQQAKVQATRFSTR